VKVLVSAQAPDIGAPVDPRFGRAPYFVIVDLERDEWVALSNTAATAGQGAGIDAARYAVEQGVEAVLTGAAGPNAFRTLDAAGLAVYAVASGSVEDAIGAFRRSALPRFNDASVPAHHGTGAGAMGRGMGGGMSRGGATGGRRAGQGRGGRMHGGRQGSAGV